MTTLELREIPESHQLDPFSQWIMDYGRDLDHALVDRLKLEGDFSVPPKIFALINEKAFDASVPPDKRPAISSLHSLGAPALQPGKVIDRVVEALGGPSVVGNARFNVQFPPMAEELTSPTILDKLNSQSVEITIDPFNQPWSLPGPVANADSLVITAIIDDMVNLANHHFLAAPNASRIDFAWVQDIPPNAGRPSVPTGREFQRTEIEQAITNNGGDEDRIMRALGLIDFERTGPDSDYNPLAARMNHGTAVASLAAGLDPATADVDRLHRNRIITVAIPRRVTLDTTGYTLTYPFIYALEYVLQRTRDIQAKFGKAIPVVINFSYGVANGPHDGRHLMELAARELIRRHIEDRSGGPATLTLPAGNANLGRGHRRGVDGSETFDLPWRLQPGDQTPSFLEIWFPPETTSIDSVKVTAPNGDHLNVGPFDLSDPVKMSGYLIAKADDTPADTTDNPIIGMLAVNQPLGSEKKRLIIVLGPTEVPVRPLYRGFEVAKRTVPSGIWEIDVKADQVGPNSRIEAWILRDEAPLGTRVQARQSFFDDDNYERFTKLGDVKTRDSGAPTSHPLTLRSGTLNGIATRPDPVNPGSMEPANDDPLFVAGAHLGKGGYLDRHDQYKDRQESGYSATAAPGMRQPDAAGESDYSRATAGKIAAGTRSASLVSLNGTSVAAPQLARRIAGYYAADSTATPADLRSRLNSDIMSPPPPPKDATLDEARAGKGRPPPQNYPLKVAR